MIPGQGLENGDWVICEPPASPNGAVREEYGNATERAE